VAAHRRFEVAVFHSFEQPAGAERVVQVLGQALAGADFTAQNGAAQWAEAVRLFRERPVLLVWDNFESTLPAFQDAHPGGSGFQPRSSERGAHRGNRPLPPGQEEADASLSDFDTAARAELQRLFTDLTAGDPAPRGRLLFTCRPAQSGLPGIKELGLAGLARPDALHLLRAVTERRSIDLERTDYDRPAIERLLDRLEDHPLSIELVAPHLKALTPQQILDDFAAHLGRFADATQREGRNRSLLASLDFSRRRLGSEAQGVLPWLAWFQSGVFERFFLAFAELAPEAWGRIRPELEATALLRVEVLPQFNTPFLKLHPTLPNAARAEPQANRSGAEGRFIQVYLKVGATVEQALRGTQPATGMALMAREEANLRRALALCFQSDRHREGAGLAETLSDYLERAGRNRERDALVAWVREQMPQDRLDGAACGAIHQHAWSLFTQGRRPEAGGSGVGPGPAGAPGGGGAGGGEPGAPTSADAFPTREDLCRSRPFGSGSGAPPTGGRVFRGLGGGAAGQPLHRPRGLGQCIFGFGPLRRGPGERRAGAGH